MLYFYNKLFSLSRVLKQIIVLLNDILIALISTYIAIFISYDNLILSNNGYFFIYSISVIFFLPFFVPFGLYQSIFRYSGIYSLLNIFLASSAYGVLFFVIISLSKLPSNLYIVGLIQPIFFFILISASRVIVVAWYHTSMAPLKRKQALIYGAGEAGAQVIKKLKEFSIVGFIDDDHNKHGKKIDNKNIYKFDELSKIILKKNVTNIIVAIPSLDKLKRREILEKLSKYNVGIRILPSLEDILIGKFNILEFNNFDLNDLISRNINWDTEKIYQNIRSKNILITGSGGSIGSELCKLILKMQPSAIILIDNTEKNLYEINRSLNLINREEKLIVKIIPILCSVNNSKKLSTIFNKFNPQIIYHAAAYKHVPLIEENIFSAVRNNILGTWNLLQMIKDYNVEQFTLISTDKAVRPTNVMGATKRIAELCVQSFYENLENKNLKMSIVRFGNVIGSSGSAIPLFMSQLKDGGPITITHHEVTRYFMSIHDAVGLVLHSSMMSKGGEVFILDMGKPIKILDLAKKLIHFSGLTIKNSLNPNGDIKINFIGLRKGEKMHEELFHSNETFSTEHKDISMAKENSPSFQEMNKIIENLEIAIDTFDEKSVIKTFENYADALIKK